MKSSTGAWRWVFWAAGTAALLLGAGVAYSQQPAPGKKAPAAPAVTESQAQATAILMRMAEFLGRAQGFSVSIRGGYDAVQQSGQKIEFGETRKVTLSRPDRLRVEGARSDGTKTLTVFNGKEIVLIDAASNAYATAPQPGGVDETIVHFVKDLGMRLPLAVLLVSQLPAELKDRVRSIDYVEKTNIYGSTSHHLAARTDTVDFQVWVADGEKPLPQRVVITYKKAKGEPQFWAQFSEWNLAPAIEDSMFLVKPPDGAQKVPFAAQLPRLSPVGRKPSAEKGAK
ncbi:MAG TPA: DUF2092 domain-containing protein [Terriglobia bacterium]|jgi:hypothetical protein